MNNPETVVIDNGSAMCRLGFAGEDGPRSYFPSIVGRNLFTNLIVGVDQKLQYFGDQAMQKINKLNLTSPIDRDTIVKWDDMTKIWNFGYWYELRRDPSDHTCLMSEPFDTPRAQRQKITEIMFQNLSVPKFYLEKSAKMALYASGAITGLIVDCGHSLTQYCPFIDGQYIPYAVQICEFGGLDLNQYLIKLLKQVSVKLHHQQTFKLRNIKSTHCYVALDYQAQLLKPKESLYQLPDGRKVSLTDQRFRCPEILFSPNMIGRKVPGIHESIFNAIRSCDKLVADKLYERIYLTGGSTMFPGFTQRLTKQLKNLAPQNIKLNVVKTSQPNGQKFNWVGGSIEASLSSFDSMYITKKQYQQFGSKIVNKKCIT